jgi:hypothetical protein
MRLFFLIISFSLLSHSFAQDSTKYRFSFGVSGLSIMNYGLKDFENVSSPIHPDYYKVYNTEKYTLDYQNFSISKGLSFDFYYNIINNSKYSLRIGSHLFFEKYKEELTYTLTDIGDGSLMDYGIYTNPFIREDIPLGYSETITFSNKDRKTGGTMFDVVLFRKLKNNWNIGGGLFYVYRMRYEWYDIEKIDSYQPWVLPRARNSYRTKQMGISVELQKSIDRFNGYLNLSQTVLTTKKEENKGGPEFRDMQTMVPLSQNLDFRFPLIIKLGIVVEFGEIVNKKEFRTIGMLDF